ncbi:MAG: GNAT family N-acetyltransferase [Gemmatimonadetes bacterium]|nr:GNAT family N-acetyltransferase [Gemmatimonadota bacterium]
MSTPRPMYETERLTVRHIVDDDVDAMQAVYGDAEGMRWVDDGDTMGHAGCAEWIRITHRNYRERGYGMSAVVLKETGDVVGFCGVVHPGGQPEPEIKYAFLRAWWGRGLATETVRGMIDYARNRHGIRRIIATTYPQNYPSHNVLRKAGMRDAGVRPDGDGTNTQYFVWTADDVPPSAPPGAAAGSEG